MADAVIRRDATVARTVIAEQAIVGPHASAGAPRARHPALIGARRRVPAERTVSAGDQLEPNRPRDLWSSVR